jgi:pyruvate-formate lyase-activating enzyme
MVIKFDHRHKPLDGDLLLTVACPVECDFCVYSCTASKKKEKWMLPEVIRRVAEQYSKNDIGIRVSGGEPFYDPEKLEECIDILLEYYKPIEILLISSGIFAFSEKNAEKNLKMLKRKKLDTLVISSDRFHLKRVPLSNIENILKAAEKVGIEIVIRITLDGESNNLLQSLAELIAKYRTPIELHLWGVFGRAEHLDTSPLKEAEKAEAFFWQKMSEFSKKYNSPSDPRYYLTHCAKRSQRVYASDFFPTTFPNGNVYGCSMTAKGCYLGNIMNEELLDMLVRWKKSLPGFFNLSNMSCLEIKRFLPERFNSDRCEFCRNLPFDEAPKEAVGRIGVKITMDMNLERLADLMNEKREYLLSFRLEPEDLSFETGNRIKNFLDNLDERKVKYFLSRPLPKCLGINFKEDTPKNCYECRELFFVEGGRVRYCEPFRQIMGQDIEVLKDRKQIFDYFVLEKRKFKPIKKCRECLYFLRKQCDGLCFFEDKRFE